MSVRAGVPVRRGGSPRTAAPDVAVPAMRPAAEGALRVLRMDFDLTWESAPYNQLTLPLVEAQRITYSTYFPVPLGVPAAVDLVAGDGTLRGYLRGLRSLRGRSFDLVHVHGPHMGIVFLALRRLLGLGGIPTLYTVHNCYGSYRPRNRLMLLPIFAAFDLVVCCGRASYESFPSPYRRLAGDRLRYVPNGVDLGRVDRALAAAGPPDARASSPPRDARRRRDEASDRGTEHAADRPVPAAGGRRAGFRVLTIGRLVPIKNQSALLRALRVSGCDDTELLIVGRGALRGQLEEEAAALGLGASVRFAGQVPRDEVFRLAADADLFVSTSRGEGMPVAVLEAMASGCPVVLSDIPSHREIAERTDVVPLVDPDDVGGFAREIRRFREMPEARRAEIGAACRRVVEEGFDLDSMVRGYVRLYGELTGREADRAIA